MIHKILIVGLGSIGKRHYQIARSLLPEAEIRILRHAKLETQPYVDFIEIYTQEEAIEFKPDIAIISNPAPHHMDITKKLLNIGSHVLVEKPISDTVLDRFEVLKIAEETKSIKMLGYNLRFSPSLIQFKQAIENGKIGTVYTAYAEVGQFLPNWRPNRDYRLSVSSSKALGGGVLLELSHEIDYLLWIFGKVDWIFAETSKQSSLEIDVEDTAILILSFHESDIAPKLLCNLNLDFIRHESKRECTVVGELGTLKWNAQEGTVSLKNKNNEDWEILYQQKPIKDETLIFEWKHFLHCIEKNVEPMTTFEDGFEVLKIVEAAKISSDLGKKMYIRYV
jgi:predicted dehydrogenase